MGARMLSVCQVDIPNRKKKRKITFCLWNPTQQPNNVEINKIYS